MKKNRWQTNYVWQKDNAERINAQKRGDMFYMRLNPICKKGHHSKRYVKTDKCIECNKEARKNYRATKTKEELKALRKKYGLKQSYNISINDYETLLKNQNYKCEICKDELDLKKNTHLDHCHEINKVRGILCHSCNLGLGQFKHNVDYLQAAIKYLHDKS